MNTTTINGTVVVEIARVDKTNITNRISLARNLKLCEAFRACSLHDIIEAIRCHERDGLIKSDDTDIILYHDAN